jgi:hypothetical protein
MWDENGKRIKGVSIGSFDAEGNFALVGINREELK